MSANTSGVNLIRAFETMTNSSGSTNPVRSQVTVSSSSSNSTNELADVQSAELGIQQCYNLSILSVCKGRYSTSVQGEKLDVSSCIFTTPISQ